MDLSGEPTYAFCLCLTRTGSLTHLGFDCGHPSLAPGHPKMTLCSAVALSLPRGADPWEGIGNVECRRCLMAAAQWMTLPGWPNVGAARLLFETVHAKREEAHG